jgi:hydrogenase nickel incorporation protein HypA/HybF
MFEAVAHGTVAEGAALKVNVLPVRHHCQNCGADFDGSAKDLPCPECEHPHTELMGGEEIRVLEVQVDDNAA